MIRGSSGSILENYLLSEWPSAIPRGHWSPASCVAAKSLPRFSTLLITLGDAGLAACECVNMDVFRRASLPCAPYVGAVGMVLCITLSGDGILVCLHCLQHHESWNRTLEQDNVNFSCLANEKESYRDWFIRKVQTSHDTLLGQPFVWILSCLISRG